MTKRQRENVAKYLYDVSKLVFATAVVGNVIVWDRFRVIAFLFGAVTAACCFAWAYLLDGVVTDE